jgi:hypothetical protein
VTEGSYLEPDLVSGTRYLEAIRDVFARGAGPSPAARAEVRPPPDALNGHHAAAGAAATSGLGRPLA